IAYAPEERRVFVSDESGRRDFVIDAATNSVVARIELDGGAGNTQFDVGSHCVIVGGQAANQLARVGAVHGSLGRPPAFAHTVAVDPTTHRVYLPLANVSGHPVLRVLVPSDSH